MNAAELWSHCEMFVQKDKVTEFKGDFKLGELGISILGIVALGERIMIW